MRFPVHVEGQELVGALDRLLELLGNSQHILFEAMVTVTSSTKTPFIAPSTPGEFTKKRNEIAAILRSPSMLRGFETALRLFEETYSVVAQQGGVPGSRPDDVLSKIVLKTDRPDETVFLSKDLRWVVEWPVRSHRGNVGGRIGCEWHASVWGAVVPPYVVNYLSTAAAAHMLQRNDVAVALLSIAAEATLRDVLTSRGYSFAHGASRTDVYAYCNARVSADPTGDRYMIEFTDQMPLTVADFQTSFATEPVHIQVRRVLKGKNNKRIDLQILAPQPLHEHWSSSKIFFPAANTVSGLGAALDIARHREQCVTAEDLAEDFDEVLQVVRNNLVHLSGAALSTALPQYDSLEPSGSFTLRDFLKNDGLVHDFVVTIPRFITDQYVKLRHGGTLFA